MINIKIFGTLLECAYDVDVLYFEQSVPKLYRNVNKEEIKQGCYILTSDGDVEIYTNELVEYKDGEAVHSFSSRFKSNLRSIEKESIQELIKGQLETEAFLEFGDDKKVNCSCEYMY